MAPKNQGIDALLNAATQQALQGKMPGAEYSAGLNSIANALRQQIMAQVQAAQQAPPAAPAAQRSPTRRAASAPPAPLTPGGGWGGTENLILRLVNIAGVPKGMYSGKRSTPSPVAGTRSDHYTGNKNAYASDISFGSQTPTPTGDRYASRIVEALGGPKNWGRHGGNFRQTINGFRYQVIYRSQVGGNHNNHVHVGVHRV